ncbi:MAG: bifunctional 5,10-methylenetetrahydrofolate dehydrogenase/5,10-methenyltetrahydrofolate cyclohydrolase [Patescibacteria group bacterium]|jgi:methylenetetrahydrofolate dehydrogenase (NADP+)/methenyltetrahydrofolate cyclohydrolase
MHLLNGKIISQQIISVIKTNVAHLPKIPGLAVILVGRDPASHLYVSLKEKACLDAGIKFEKYVFPEDVSEAELLKKIKELNNEKDVDGILVQLPLPKQDADRIIAAISPAKDVDGFHSENLCSLEAGKKCLISPVVLGVMRLINETREPLTQKKVVLVMGKVLARPFYTVLNGSGAQVEVVSPNTKNLEEKTKTADFLITAVGQPNLITGKMVKDGVVVIDIGTSKVEKKVVGDIERASVEAKASWLTPVPGGVGPMTVAMLLQNVLVASR